MLRGTFELIGDKSISHRSIMFSAISKGNNKVSNFLMGQDCLSTVSCFRKMGVDIEIAGKDVFIKGNGIRGLKPPTDILDVGNSGTTIRLIMGILAGNDFESTLIGDESIGKRPMKRVTDPLRMMGCDITGKDDANFTPITVRGGHLHSIDYKMPVASAQVKSAIILASLYSDGQSIIREKVKSRNHTEIMLKAFGADIKENGLDIIVNPVDELFNQDIYVPGDISSAAFIIVGALISEGSEVLIKNVVLNETRTGIIDVIKNMNGNIEIIDERVVGGEKELKVKESNRIKTVVYNLKKMGADIEELEDGMIIKGKTKLHGATIETFKDHRIAMSFSIADLISDSRVMLDDTNCINISFPGYSNLLKDLTK